MEYIYCDEVSLKEDTATALLMIADKYCVPRLKLACVKFLISCLTVQNVIDISILAHTADAKELEKGTVDFIKNNWEDVFEQNDIKKLPYPTLFEVCKQKPS